MTDTDTVELKPCPFCGDDMRDSITSDPMGFARGDGPVYAVECNLLTCNALGPWKPTIEEAVTAWNARTIAALPPAVPQIKPLTWYGKPAPLTWFGRPNPQEQRIGRCGQIAYSVRFDMEAWGYSRSGETGFTVSRIGGTSFKDEADAIDGADEDHERRIREALITAPPLPMRSSTSPHRRTPHDSTGTDAR